MIIRIREWQIIHLRFLMLALSPSISFSLSFSLSARPHYTTKNLRADLFRLFSFSICTRLLSASLITQPVKICQVHFVTKLMLSVFRQHNERERPATGQQGEIESEGGNGEVKVFVTRSLNYFYLIISRQGSNHPRNLYNRRELELRSRCMRESRDHPMIQHHTDNRL